MKAHWLILSFLLPVVAMGQTDATDAQAAAKTPPAQVIKLERVSDFAQGNDWVALFKDYESRGSYRNLIQLPDGRLLVTAVRTYNILVFNAQGRFLKTLWPKGRREASSLTIYNRPGWLSALGERLLFVSELGRVRVFGLDGKPVSQAVIDHPVECLIPLNETTVAVAGTVARENLANLVIIALVDLTTGKETVLRDMPEADLKPVRTKDGKSVLAQAPHARVRPFVRALGPNEFAAGFTNWPEIEIFNAAGELLRSFRIRDLHPMDFTIRSLESMGTDSTKSKDGKITTFGSYLGVSPPPGEKAPAVVLSRNDPDVYYFNFTVDRQGRFLVFSFPAEGNDPIVRILSPAGELLREAKIETGDYRITFSPGEAGPIFDGEYLITLAEEKAAKGMPLRLMKFKLSGL